LGCLIVGTSQGSVDIRLSKRRRGPLLGGRGGFFPGAGGERRVYVGLGEALILLIGHGEL
jgi:hypothetical protein